jgi:hypothetical protein
MQPVPGGHHPNVYGVGKTTTMRAVRAGQAGQRGDELAQPGFPRADPGSSALSARRDRLRSRPRLGRLIMTVVLRP